MRLWPHRIKKFKVIVKFMVELPARSWVAPRPEPTGISCAPQSIWNPDESQYQPSCMARRADHPLRHMKVLSCVLRRPPSARLRDGRGGSHIRGSSCLLLPSGDPHRDCYYERPNGRDEGIWVKPDRSSHFGLRKLICSHPIGSPAPPLPVPEEEQAPGIQPALSATERSSSRS